MEGYGFSHAPQAPGCLASMAAWDMLDEPPTMRLHPAHGNGQYRPAHACGPLSKASASKALSLANGCSNNLWSQPVAFFEDGELVIVVGTELIHIPLLFVEVHRAVRTAVLVLCIPQHDGDVPCFQDQSDDTKNIWLITVEGENDCIRRAFHAFGSAGCILPHIANEYEFAAEPLGVGASAVVFCGRRSTCARMEVSLDDKNFSEDTYIAAKVFKPAKPSSKDKEGSKPPNIITKVREEVGLLAQVSRHPNIIRLFGCFPVESCDQPQGEDGDTPKAANHRWALGLQFCSGGDLASAGVMAEDKAAQIMAGVLSGVAHLHRQQIVHRDVKAENVLLTKDEVPVVSDFGIAVHLSDKTSLQKRCGSPGYAAPELITGTDYSVKADAFSCGVLFYFVLSGKLPFAGPSIGSVLRRTQRCNVKFDEKFDKISRACKAFMLLLLQKKPESRISCDMALETPWFRGHLKKEDLSQIPLPKIQDLDLKATPLKFPAVEKPGQPQGKVVGNIIFEVDRSVTTHHNHCRYKQMHRPPSNFFDVHDSDQLEVLEVEDSSSCGWISIGSHSTAPSEASTTSSRMHLSNGRRPNKLASIRPGSGTGRRHRDNEPCTTTSPTVPMAAPTGGWHHRNDEQTDDFIFAECPVGNNPQAVLPINNGTKGTLQDINNFEIPQPRSRTRRPSYRGRLSGLESSGMEGTASLADTLCNNRTIDEETDIFQEDRAVLGMGMSCVGRASFTRAPSLLPGTQMACQALFTG